MCEIRTAKVQDSESIRRIYLAVVGPEARPDEEHWDLLIRAGGLLVAEAGERIIGFGGIDVSAAEHVKWLYLLPSYQRAGVGSQLLERLESIGWKAGLTLRLHATTGAVEFYGRHGYTALEGTKETAHDNEGVQMIKRNCVT